MYYRISGIKTTIRNTGDDPYSFEVEMLGKDVNYEHEEVVEINVKDYHEIRQVELFKKNGYIVSSKKIDSDFKEGSQRIFECELSGRTTYFLPNDLIISPFSKGRE